MGFFARVRVIGLESVKDIDIVNFNILLSADVRTRIYDMMNSLNWVKLNKKWEKTSSCYMLFLYLTHSAPSYLSSHFTYYPICLFA